MSVTRDKLQIIEGRALAALEAYLARGLELLEMPVTRDVEVVETYTRKLQERDAAFHNFRALLALLESQGVSWCDNSDVAPLLTKLQTVNQSLSQRTAAWMASLKSQMGEVRRGAAATAAYHSQNPTGGTLREAGRGLLKVV
ncbi:hypothetical protein E3A20_10770 [Planctomyces bekefii]|uniref:Flagellar protein FlgN n=1 Tax=Planctomyces bekefii TaxID=1653850 RepID=A0A5C6M6E8_9PLAN|nr:hypothetical protein E3A20_10770 [Planctomyces bekefii]